MSVRGAVSVGAMFVKQGSVSIMYASRESMRNEIGTSIEPCLQLNPVAFAAVLDVASRWGASPTHFGSSLIGCNVMASPSRLPDCASV
jgi:hypothetical protein